MSTTLGPVILVLFGLLDASPGVGVIMEKSQRYDSIQTCQKELERLTPQIKEAFPDNPFKGECVEVKTTDTDLTFKIK